MAGVAQHVMLAVACVGLLGAADRLLGERTEGSIDRLVEVVVLAVAAAVAEALLLGLLGLGSRPVALTIAALATYVAAALASPAPRPRLGTFLSQRVAALGTPERAAVGALSGVAVVLLVWPLLYPVIGFDGALYHLPEIAAWVADGRPGSIALVNYVFPFANYPVTNEVALAWATGISSSLVPIVLWTQLLVVVAAFAGFAGLRALGVGRVSAAVAVGAVLTTPVLVSELGTPSTDVSALCWLVCAGALVARAVEQPKLLAPAVVAAGLAVGTKTTTAPLVVVLLAIVLLRRRTALRPYAGPLALAGALAFGVGAVWYLRNLLTHGSPLWPFRSLPGGDRVPQVWSRIEPSLLERPYSTVAGRVSGYLDQFAGALLLFPAGALGGVVARRRVTALASATCAGALLLWAAAPSTGQPDTPVFAMNPLSATRYALPAVAAAALAVALTTANGRPRKLGLAVLAAALVWNVVGLEGSAQPSVPRLSALALAAVIGAGIGSASRRLSRPGLTSGRLTGQKAALRAAAIACVALLGFLLSLPAAGLVRRHVQAAPLIPGAALARWALDQPGFESRQPIYFAGMVFGQLAGERFQHRLVLIPPDAPCELVREKAADGLLVAGGGVFAKLGIKTPAHCVSSLRPSYVSSDVRVYGTLHGPRGSRPRRLPETLRPSPRGGARRPGTTGARPSEGPAPAIDTQDDRPGLFRAVGRGDRRRAAR